MDDRHHASTNRLRTDYLHPLLYRIVLACVAVLVIAAASFYHASGFGSLWYPVMIAFAVIAVALPGVLWNIWRHGGATRLGEPAARASYHDWSHGEVSVWQARMTGADAAVTMLLPIASVAVGMVCFAVALWAAI